MLITQTKTASDCHLDIVGPAGLAGYKALHVELGRVGGRSGGQGQDSALVAL